MSVKRIKHTLPAYLATNSLIATLEHIGAQKTVR